MTEDRFKALILLFIHGEYAVNKEVEIENVKQENIVAQKVHV